MVGARVGEEPADGDLVKDCRPEIYVEDVELVALCHGLVDGVHPRRVQPQHPLRERQAECVEAAAQEQLATAQEQLESAQATAQEQLETAKAAAQELSVVARPIRGGEPAPHSSLAHFRCVIEHEVRLLGGTPNAFFGALEHVWHQEALILTTLTRQGRCALC